MIWMFCVKHCSLRYTLTTSDDGHDVLVLHSEGVQAWIEGSWHS